MSAVRRIPASLLFVAAIIMLAGCQGKDGSAGRIKWRPVFGDFSKDTTPLVAKVGEVEIRRRMVDFYIDEQPKAQQSRYEGADGRRVALKEMIDQALMVQGAMQKKLYNDSDVARQLIKERRNTLDSAMRNYGLLRGNVPDEDQMRAYFKDNQAKYRAQGLVWTRHVECLNKKDADRAYTRLRSGTPKNDFAHVVAEMSVNKDTRKIGGDNGWFAKGGFVPYMRQAKEFTTAAFDLEKGLNEPIKVGDHWHVVEVLDRKYGRPMSFTEAKDQVAHDMLPGYQDAVLKDYLLAARKEFPVTMMGIYAPGQGATEDELFQRAMAVTDPQKKLDLLTMIHTDYPQGSRADDALFMSANLALERFQDGRIAERYLTMLIDEYPDSEFIEDAKFLRDNIYNPKVRHPKSIEDLKQN